MPRLERDDGIELHWEERGSGDLVVVACHWSGYPPVFEPLIGQLASDHRVASYDARGTGRSTRAGPHDMLTGAADLAAVIEAAGGPAVVVTMTDACNRAVRIGAERPDLVSAVFAAGTLPLPRAALSGTDALIASDSVVEAFTEMLETNYRGAQRTMMATSNTQMSEDEVRGRVDLQVAYCPREVAIERVRAWANDNPLDAARICGDRLCLLASPGMVGPWFPPTHQIRELLSRWLPQARLVEIADGIVSRPDLTAEVMRKITAEGGGPRAEQAATSEPRRGGS